MEELSEGDKKLIADIEEYGWHVVKVMEDDSGPGFCYSIGLYETFGLPEIIIIGLPPDLAHDLINIIGEDLREGKTYISDKYYSDIIEGHDCYMLEVNRSLYKDYFGYGIWYYEEQQFPALQCIYPSTDNIYPWDWDEEEREHQQPVLGNYS